MTLAFTAGEGGPGVFEPRESVTRTQPAAVVVGNLAAALARASMARCSRSISLRTGAGVSTSIECCTTGNSKGTLPAAPRPAAARKAAIPAPAIKAAIATARMRRTVRPTRERSALRLRHLSPATNFSSSGRTRQGMQPPLAPVLLLGQGALALSVLNTTRAICRLRQRIASAAGLAFGLLALELERFRAAVRTRSLPRSEPASGIADTPRGRAHTPSLLLVLH